MPDLGTSTAGPVTLDINKLIETHAAVVANPGGGKSYCVRKILELAAGGPQRIVLDVEDEFYTLREATPSLLIAGGANGDCPAKVDNAAALALFLLQTGIDAVIQINDLGLTGQRMFIARFIEAMISAPTSLWHPTLVVLDEVQRVAPEGAPAESSEAVVSLLMQGRKRGFGALIATQRLARVSKNVTGAVNNWLLGRAGQTIDRRSVADILGVTLNSDEARGLPRLQPGQFWGVGPAISVEPTLVTVARSSTTHLRAGQRDVPTPPAPEQVRKMLMGLHVEPTAAAEDAVAPARATDPKVIEVAEQRGYERGLAEGRRIEATEQIEARRELDTAVQAALRYLAPFAKREDGAPVIDVRHPAAPLTIDAEPMQRVARRGLGPAAAPLINAEPVLRPSAEKFSPSTRKILDQIHRAHPIALTFAAAAARAGISKRSSQYRLYRQQIDASGEVETIDGRYRSLRPSHDEAAGVGPLDAWASKLPPSYGQMLRAVADQYPLALTRGQIAELAGVSRTSSGLGAGLRELVSLGLIEGNGDTYRLAKELRADG